MILGHIQYPLFFPTPSVSSQYISLLGLCLFFNNPLDPMWMGMGPFTGAEEVSVFSTVNAYFYGCIRAQP